MVDAAILTGAIAATFEGRAAGWACGMTSHGIEDAYHLNRIDAPSLDQVVV